MTYLDGLGPAHAGVPHGKLLDADGDDITREWGKSIHDCLDPRLRSAIATLVDHYLSPLTACFGYCQRVINKVQLLEMALFESQEHLVVFVRVVRKRRCVVVSTLARQFLKQPVVLSTAQHSQRKFYCSSPASPASTTHLGEQRLRSRGVG